MHSKANLEYHLCSKERVYLRGNQMKRQEDKPQICLPKGRENKFFIIIKVELYAYWWKGQEKLWLFMRTNGECILSKHICNIYPTFTLKWRPISERGKIQPLTWGAYLRTRRKGCSQLGELNQYKLDGILECRALILPGWNHISWLWVQATVETAKGFVRGSEKTQLD